MLKQVLILVLVLSKISTLEALSSQSLVNCGVRSGEICSLSETIKTRSTQKYIHVVLQVQFDEVYFDSLKEVVDHYQNVESWQEALEEKGLKNVYFSESKYLFLESEADNINYHFADYTIVTNGPDYRIKELVKNRLVMVNDHYMRLDFEVMNHPTERKYQLVMVKEKYGSVHFEYLPESGQYLVSLDLMARPDLPEFTYSLVAPHIEKASLSLLKALYDFN